MHAYEWLRLIIKPMYIVYVKIWKILQYKYTKRKGIYIQDLTQYEIIIKKKNNTVFKNKLNII